MARLAQLEALCRRQFAPLLLDGVQLADTAQCLRGNRTAIGSMQVEELAAYVGHARQLGDAGSEHGFVARVIVNHQLASPARQEGTRMRASTAGLIVEHNDARPLVQVIGSVGP